MVPLLIDGAVSSFDLFAVSALAAAGPARTNETAIKIQRITAVKRF